ncbi:hypothetical protein ACH3XW_10365 [Acanthocheilonema viteae]
MDVREESNNTQSNANNAAIDGAIDISHNQSLPTQEFSQNPTPPTETVSATTESNNSSSNYPAPHPNPVHLTIYPPKNGLTVSPVFYTNPPSRATTNSIRSHSYPGPPTTISVYSEILRSRAPTSDDAQNPSSIPSSNATRNNPPEPTNNPSEPIEPSRQITPATQTVQDSIEPIQQAKKRGRKRLSESANGAEVANIASDNSIPKKRGRKRKDGNDCIAGKANDASSNEMNNRSISVANSERNIKANAEEAQSEQNPIKLIQSLNEMPNVNEVKEEKTKKKRPGRKIATKSDGTVNDTKKRNSTTGKASAAAKKQCMEELLNSQKSRMAFPKGTFLIRYSDLETLDCDQIWCVDNHHMLLKYRLSSHIEGKRRLYLKSQPERFVGWKCEEPWHYYQLTVLERDRDGSKVLIIYPDAKELAECREKAKRQKQLAEEMKQGLGTSHNSDDVKLNFAEIGKGPAIKEEEHFMDTDDQRLHAQQNIEVQMADEAANAIERFILISDDHSTAMDDENVAEEAVGNITEEEMITNSE